VDNVRGSLARIDDSVLLVELFDPETDEAARLSGQSGFYVSDPH
jgi:hypothetical protein